MEYLYYETPSMKRKEEAEEYIREHLEANSNINGSGGLNRYEDDYEGWLKKIENDTTCIPNEERVPALTYFLIRQSDDKIIGMVNIRLTLNKRLEREGGHIGYGIRPSERRKGYNKINLYRALEVCQENGLEEVVLDCNTENLGSSKTMIALGGEKVWQKIIDDEDISRYKINVSESLKKYENVYGKKEKVK